MNVYVCDDTAAAVAARRRGDNVVDGGVEKEKEREREVWGGSVAGLPGGWSTRWCVQPNNL